MKILLCTGCGLNDTFSALAYLMDFCFRIRIPYNSINVWTLYRDFVELIDVKDIVFLMEHPKKEDFDIVYDRCIGTETNLNIRTERHLSNFITPNDKLKNLFKKEDHANTIAVHLRCMGTEHAKMTAQEEMDQYVLRFKSIYSDQKNYLIFSDHQVVKEQEFFKKENIKICPHIDPITDENTLVEDTVTHYRKKYKRKDRNISTMKDIYLMSMCPIVYKTSGNFTSLTKIFNPFIDIKNLP